MKILAGMSAKSPSSQEKPCKSTSEVQQTRTWEVRVLFNKNSSRLRLSLNSIETY